MTEYTHRRRSLLKIRPGDVVLLGDIEMRVVRFDANTGALHLAPLTGPGPHPHLVAQMGERAMIRRREVAA